MDITPTTPQVDPVAVVSLHIDRLSGGTTLHGYITQSGGKYITKNGTVEVYDFADEGKAKAVFDNLLKRNHKVALTKPGEVLKPEQLQGQDTTADVGELPGGKAGPYTGFGADEVGKLERGLKADKIMAAKQSLAESKDALKKRFIALMEDVDMNYQPPVEVDVEPQAEVTPNAGEGLTKFAPTPASKVLKSYNVDRDFLTKAIGFGGVAQQAVDQIMGAIDAQQCDGPLCGSHFDSVASGMGGQPTIATGPEVAPTDPAALPPVEPVAPVAPVEPIAPSSEAPVDTVNGEPTTEPVVPTEPTEEEPK